MPVYLYKCPHCHAERAIPRSVSERDLAVMCPACKGWFMDRVPTASNFVVKGYAAKSGYSSKE